MLIKLNDKHSQMLDEYINAAGDEAIYLLKPYTQLNEGNLEGVFYGYMEADHMTAVFFFSNKSVLSLHVVNQRALGNLDLLKAIKYHKPKFIKGLSTAVDGIYRLICRATSATSEAKILLMKYNTGKAEAQIQEPKLESLKLLSGRNKMVDTLINDMKFFIDVETHFGRQVKAINDLSKDLKLLMDQDNYVLGILETEIVAQGFIEDETDLMGVLSGIYVSPKHRRRGYAKAISISLTNKLLQRGKQPYLFVKNNNQEAKQLYEKIGYKGVETYTLMTVNY
ncbi:MAG: hypothetical protein BGO41_02880 [Clostridiales bacterium 38-18]|nr:MAG: hypothetical protein BGO41_02880 [Clostridiales bacterium 38-18]